MLPVGQRQRMVPDEALLQGVERARPDVAVDDSQRAEGQGRGADRTVGARRVAGAWRIGRPGRLAGRCLRLTERAPSSAIRRWQTGGENHGVVDRAIEQRRGDRGYPVDAEPDEERHHRGLGDPYSAGRAGERRDGEPRATVTHTTSGRGVSPRAQNAAACAETAAETQTEVRAPSDARRSSPSRGECRERVVTVMAQRARAATPLQAPSRTPRAQARIAADRSRRKCRRLAQSAAAAEARGEHVLLADAALTTTARRVSDPSRRASTGRTTPRRGTPQGQRPARAR